MCSKKMFSTALLHKLLHTSHGRWWTPSDHYGHKKPRIYAGLGYFLDFLGLRWKSYWLGDYDRTVESKKDFEIRT